MKLATQYTRASMLVTVIILLIAGGVYYLAIAYITNQQFDHDLIEEFGERNAFIQQHQRFPKSFESDNYQVTFEPIGQNFYQPQFKDTLIQATDLSKAISGRAIIATVTLKGINYRTTIIESKEATKSLVKLIFIITLALTIILLIALFFTNRILLNGLWQPFYHLLNRLRAFSLIDKNVNNQEQIGIDEFRQLQLAVSSMEQKASNEYDALKIFTENASHELMTPIAVITSKLDNLIQDDTLTAAQLLQLQDIYNAANKLSRLSQSLLLLVKIDHQLIKDITPIKLDQVIIDKIKQFSEIASQKYIATTSRLQSVTVTASPYLIDILFNNLLGNAIRHNHSYGEIRIDLETKQLIISNTGANKALDETKIFERFQKGVSSEGTGLGLTIAQNICKGYGWKLAYSFESPHHVFVINF